MTREWTPAIIGAGLGLVVWALMIGWPNEVATALDLLAYVVGEPL